MWPFPPLAAVAEPVPAWDEGPAPLPWDDAPEERRRRDATPEDTERLELARIAASATYVRGEQLVGVGSVGRFDAFLPALDLRVERYADEGPGFGFALSAFPPPSGADDGLFLRGELYGGGGLDWEGDLPGSVVVGLGVGGDYVDVGSQDPGRFYGVARARLTSWLRGDVTMALALESLPLVASPVPVSQHEHRIELASSFGLFEMGGRAAFTFQQGGLPERPFVQHALGLFAGVVVR